MGLVRALGGRGVPSPERRVSPSTEANQPQVHAVSLHSRVEGATLVSGSRGSSSLLLYQAMANDFG